ncbi:hypothetical protein [Corynebacterium argentoratense]|uniref:hypothetical protein n=1 Tax=Corynebacterium argentoratense TaxID=42817 RepID=UPI001F315B65|nr:hypothetical protein [Corynebacterium argentoratense]MCF1694331.1 hypothetical protein [Corynebacterium argentoratense]MCF1735902.1 hypothetical protein [Corynebacterium argentoratense]
MYPPQSPPPTGGGNTFGTPQSSGMQQGVFVPPGQPEPEPDKQGLSKGTKITLIILGLLLTLVVMFAVGFAAGQLSKSNDTAGATTPAAASATHMAEGNQDTQWPTRDTTAPLRPLEPDEPEIYTQPGFDVWDPCDMPEAMQQKLGLEKFGNSFPVDGPEVKICGFVHYPTPDHQQQILLRMLPSTIDIPLAHSLSEPLPLPESKGSAWQIFPENANDSCISVTRTDKGQLMMISDTDSSTPSNIPTACATAFTVHNALLGIT